MDAQIKHEIIAEITTAAVKTIEEIVRESLKRTLLKILSTKRLTKLLIKSSAVPQFNNKGTKIRYDTNNSIIDKKSKKQ